MTILLSQKFTITKIYYNWVAKSCWCRISLDLSVDSFLLIIDVVIMPLPKYIIWNLTVSKIQTWCRCFRAQKRKTERPLKHGKNKVYGIIYAFATENLPMSWRDFKKGKLAWRIMDTNLEDWRRTSGGTCCKNGMIGLRKNLYLSLPETGTWGCSLGGTWTVGS